MATAYIGLGSNLGDRLGWLRAAVRTLATTPGVRVAACSPVFETDAVADSPQPAYLNAVARIETTLGPDQLLGACLAVERQLGRVRPAGEVKAPRTIDLDLLLYEQQVLTRPGLQVPHPGILDRPFVRIPLAKVALPGLRHPVSGEPLDESAPSPAVRSFEGDLGI